MKKFKKLLCLSLCAIMLLGVLVSCNSGKTDAPDESESESVSDVVESVTDSEYETDENGYVKDLIPEGTTYNGEKIYILGWDGNNKLYTIPEDNSGGKVHILSKIYYNRLAVEERLDIQLEVNYMNATGDDAGGTVRSAFTTEVKSGAGNYDLIQTFSLYPAVLAQEGLLVNINNLTFPNLDMPWWPDSLADWTQYDGLYFVASNSQATAIRSMFVMYSYTDMIVGSGLVDPVELVLDGKWTIEKMMEYAKNFHGDAVAKPGEVYGLVVDDHSRMDAFYYGAGFNSTKNNAEGVAEMTLDDAGYRTRVSDYIDLLVPFFKLEEVEIANNTQILMKDKKTALMVASMANVEALSDNSYAPIPMPKLEEDDPYRTMLNNGYAMWCIPKTTADAERAGVVMEAFSSSEYREIAPYYFETVLKDRYSQDANGMEVFDIIRNAVIYDFGRVCQFALSGTVEGMWRACFATNKVKNPQNVFENKWATSGENMKVSLMELLRDFRNNNRS